MTEDERRIQYLCQEDRDTELDLDIVGPAFDEITRYLVNAEHFSSWPGPEALRLEYEKRADAGEFAIALGIHPELGWFVLTIVDATAPPDIAAAAWRMPWRLLYDKDGKLKTLGRD